ncbi:CU044_5270 family protein [Streptomyces polyrhachis]|uniref:CU044_5270 family protein n=1 Tax=Streptomyces polyrhachis TaxID=1282885 RepID=A0ABW2G867_9ACTN
MTHDILRRLADARPDHLDPAAAPDDTVRALELATAMRELPPVEARTASRRPRRPRSVWALDLAAGAAAAALAVATTATGPDAGPGGGPTAGGQALSARDMLLAAATTLEKQPQPGGAYSYQEVRIGSMLPVPGKDYVVDRRHTLRVWQSATARQRWTTGTDTGTRPASAADEAAWKADGSPRTFDFSAPHAPGGDIAHYEGAGLVYQDAPGGRSGLGTIGELSVRELLALPAEKHRLADALAELIDRKYNASAPELRKMVVETAQEVAFSMSSPPRVRAAAYRMLADEPGVRALRTARDHDGRAGYGIAMPRTFPGSPTEVRYVFDRGTGMPLGSVTVAAKAFDTWEKGDTLSYSTVVDTRWTDEAPGFTKDAAPGAPKAPGRR